MKLSAIILSIVAAVSLQVVKGDPPAVPPTSDTYIWVEYSNETERFFKYKECYPYEINGSIAVTAYWLQSATCYNFRFGNCTGDALPLVGVEIPKGASLANVADFVHLIGGSALCFQGLLPGLPLPPIEL